MTVDAPDRYRPRHMAPYVVLCPDRAVRHDGTFPTVVDAEHWAEWGHACYGPHRVIPASSMSNPGQEEGE